MFNLQLMSQMSPTTVEAFNETITNRLLLTIGPDNRESEGIRMCPTAAGSGRGQTGSVISTRFYVSGSVEKDGVDVGHADDAFVHLPRAFWTE